MIAVGGQAWFAKSDAMRGALVEHFKKIGPTGVCLQVPRIWEKFHENLAPQLKSAKGVKKTLIDWSMKQVLNALKNSQIETNLCLIYAFLPIDNILLIDRE